MYVKIRLNVEHNIADEKLVVANFVDELPIDLRRPLAKIIYKEIYEKVDYLKGKADHFIAWICPRFQPKVSAPTENIYYENDLLDDIYFLMAGSCSYVLPKFANTGYIKILPHTSFGLIDFVAALLYKSGEEAQESGIMSVFTSNRLTTEIQKNVEDDGPNQEIFEGLRRRFAVQGDDQSYHELLRINKTDLLHMQLEFEQEFA